MDNQKSKDISSSGCASAHPEEPCDDCFYDEIPDNKPKEPEISLTSLGRIGLLRTFSSVKEPSTQKQTSESQSSPSSLALIHNPEDNRARAIENARTKNDMLVSRVRDTHLKVRDEDSTAAYHKNGKLTSLFNAFSSMQEEMSNTAGLINEIRYMKEELRDRSDENEILKSIIDELKMEIPSDKAQEILDLITRRKRELQRKHEFDQLQSRLRKANIEYNCFASKKEDILVRIKQLREEDPGLPISLGEENKVKPTEGGNFTGNSIINSADSTADSTANSTANSTAVESAADEYLKDYMSKHTS